MFADCHIHMVLDGVFWKDAIAAHRNGPDEQIIRRCLAAYQAVGVKWPRDGGDRWGVCRRAAELAPEYGIVYSMPLFPIYQTGRYGSFIGRGYRDLAEYRQLVRQVAAGGGHFIKLMISGLMDFDHYGVLTDPPMAPEMIWDLVAVAHDAGFAVMAHCNGAQTALEAIQAGVDSLEHGAYLDADAAQALAESRTVWVPTLSTVGNLIGAGRYPDAVPHRILTGQMELVRRVYELGGQIACGADAGAYRVAHVKAVQDEMGYLEQALAGLPWKQRVEDACRVPRERFSPQ